MEQDIIKTTSKKYVALFNFEHFFQLTNSCIKLSTGKKLNSIGFCSVERTAERCR
ncbi:hypothetical protein ACQKNS_24280 [Peribacillus sp. NPDC094092]|uniref:hypothetical protein n=1 Tax=Peribacillus sp. NPDC094092 TaxID=3390611 RepID=UPI003CFE4CF3